MPEDSLTGSPTPASGSADGGAPPPGAVSGASASQPARNQAGEPGSQIQEALERALAPVLEKVDRIDKAYQAVQRRVRKDAAQGEQDPGDTRPNSSGESGEANASGVKDPETRALIEKLTARVEEQDKTLRGYQEKEEARAAKDLATQKKDAVRAAIFDEDGKARYDNADVLESLIGPDLRVTAEGKVMVDAGDKLIPVTDRVKELGSRDIFQFAPAGSPMNIGTGDRGGQAQASGNRPGGGELTQQQVDDMSDDEIIAMSRKVTGY